MRPQLIRLLWKEWRLGWPLLACGLLLPPLAVALARDHVTVLHTGFPVIALFLLMLGVAVSAPWTVGSVARRGYESAHFPLHPSWPLLLTFLCQGAIVALVSLSVGGWYAQVPHAAPLETTLALAGLILLPIYLTAVAVTRAISAPAGIAAGVVLGIASLSYAFRLLADPGEAKNANLWYAPFWENTNSILLPCAIAGFFAYLLLLVPKGRALPRRVLAISLLVVAAFGYIAIESFGREFFSQTNYECDIPLIMSPDGAVVVIPAAKYSRYSPDTRLIGVNRRTHRTVIRQFNELPMPLAVRGETALVMTFQFAKNRMTLFRWTLGNDILQPICTFPTNHQLSKLLRGNYAEGLTLSQSPDGRYALLAAPALVRHDHYGYDLWLIDLARQRPQLVDAYCSNQSQLQLAMSWTPGRAIVSDSYAPYAVAVPSGKITPFHLPKEGR